MKKSHQSTLMSISASTSMSFLPSKDLLSKSKNSGDFSHYLFEEGISSVDIKTSDRQERIYLYNLDENPLNTIKEFEDIDYFAATLRAQEQFMCVNCYDDISIDEVDKHSLICLKPEININKILEKVHKFIRAIREYKFDADFRYDYALIQLEDIGESIYEKRISISQIFNRINTVIKDNRNYPFILILAQRLEKIVEGLSDTPEKNIILEKNTVEVINSAIYVSVYPKNSFISMFSDYSFDITEKKDRTESAESSETLEKYFYSLCIKKKLALPHSHPAKNLSIFHLYQECLNKNIPIEQWKNFVGISLGDQQIIIS
ncbi:hypothetical protein SteCoe_11567 [Stentor coeruleus]|uniref:Uncharacterized protein n=1 Tax=Stentor coeruleus TaxID=5963 RepID=A0A1R2CCZ3_9CILI|nr:hypothetical protein SteCoe_11567 [Stentor coeruleus]